MNKPLSEKGVEAYMGFEKTKDVFYSDDVEQAVKEAYRDIMKDCSLEDEDLIIEVFKDKFGFDMDGSLNE